jgi:hypothetical protein
LPGRLAKVFVSYRRADTAPYAGRLHDHLVDRFGADQVFMDVTSVAPGVDFARLISRTVASSDVLVALLGSKWLALIDDKGPEERDWVRLEIEVALNRDLLVVPVLVEGAEMPREHELPEGLQPLTRRNAITLRHSSFKADVMRIIGVIEGRAGTQQSVDEATGTRDPGRVERLRELEDLVRQRTNRPPTPWRPHIDALLGVLDLDERVVNIGVGTVTGEGRVQTLTAGFQMGLVCLTPRRILIALKGNIPLPFSFRTVQVGAVRTRIIPFSDILSVDKSRWSKKITLSLTTGVTSIVFGTQSKDEFQDYLQRHTGT